PAIGALVEGPAGYGHLSGRANLALFDAAGPGGPAGGRRTRRARVSAALERVGLGGIDRRPLRAYSLGMRQRLGLAAALLRQPRLLVLDEPTNGLDPRGIREIRDLLAELNAAGTTVLLSSHLLAEVEALCSRVGVMDRGKLVLQDDLAALRAPTGRPGDPRRTGEAGALPAHLARRRPAVRAAVRRRGVPRHHAHPAAARAGRRVPVRGAARRLAVPGGGDRADRAGVPAGRGRGA